MVVLPGGYIWRLIQLYAEGLRVERDEDRAGRRVEARARRRHVRVERHVSGHKFGDAIRVGEEDEVSSQRF